MLNRRTINRSACARLGTSLIEHQGHVGTNERGIRDHFSVWQRHSLPAVAQPMVASQREGVSAHGMAKLQELAMRQTSTRRGSGGANHKSCKLTRCEEGESRSKLWVAWRENPTVMSTQHSSLQNVLSPLNAAVPTTRLFPSWVSDALSRRTGETSFQSRSTRLSTRLAQVLDFLREWESTCRYQYATMQPPIKLMNSQGISAHREDGFVHLPLQWIQYRGSASPLRLALLASSPRPSTTNTLAAIDRL